MSSDLISAVVVGAVLLVSGFLAVVVVRRARRARQAAIDSAGEKRPLPARRASSLEEAEPDGDDETSPHVTREVPVDQEVEPARREPARGARAAVEHPPARVLPFPATPPAAATPVPATPVPPPTKKPAKKDATALTQGLAKTRGGWVARLGSVFTGKKEIDPALVEEIEKVLLTADIGVRTSAKLLEEIRNGLSKKELTNPSAVWDFLRRRTTEILAIEGPTIDFGAAKPFVLLIIGVNGSGKTTTIGKLSAKLKAEGRSVILAAGDTFRAAATEQLEVWGQRAGCAVVRGKEGGDPSSVIFDAIKRAKTEGIDVVIADTAGRLHTKTELMDELGKVRRVIGKAQEGAPHETWLVLDSTSGQNAIQQAQIFTAAMAVSGIVLTKLDGTAKGGVILGISDQLRIPVRFIGVGERVEDLRPFDAEEFVDALYEENASAAS